MFQSVFDPATTLAGLSAINPATHLMRVDPFKRTGSNHVQSRPESLNPAQTQTNSDVPNIAVVPPTPDFHTNNKTVSINQIQSEVPGPFRNLDPDSVSFTDVNFTDEKPILPTHVI